MSALLRALMMQQAATETPNLAVITDFTTQVDKLGNRGNYGAGVTANIKPGVKYLVKFKVTLTISESSGLSDLYVTQTWPNNHWASVPFARILGGEIGVPQTKEVEEINSVRKAVNSENLYLFTLDATNFKGTVRIWDLSITEV